MVMTSSGPATDAVSRLSVGFVYAYYLGNENKVDAVAHMRWWPGEERGQRDSLSGLLSAMVSKWPQYLHASQNWGGML